MKKLVQYKKNIGLLFSRGNLINFLNAKKNREFDLPSNAIINKFDNVDDNRTINGLSGGEELLIALSNELSKNKKIYLFDEITSNLDETHLLEVMNIIKKKSEESLIVMATHDKRISNYGIEIVINKIR